MTTVWGLRTRRLVLVIRRGVENVRQQVFAWEHCPLGWFEDHIYLAQSTDGLIREKGASHQKKARSEVVKINSYLTEHP